MAAGALLVGVVLYWARSVLIPLAVAALLTFLLTPLVTALQRRGVTRPIAVLLVVAMAVAVLGGVAWVLTAQVWSLAEELPRYRGNIRQKIVDLRGAGRSTALGRLQRLVDDVAGEIKKQAPGPGQARTAEPAPVVIVPDNAALLRQLPALVEPLVTTGLVLALLVFMLLRRAELRNRLLRLAGGGRIPVTTRALDEAADRISHYLVMQTAINGVFGLAVGLGLFLIGVPYAVLWGFLASTLRFVPYVGAWLSALLPLTLALAVFPGWREPLLVSALFVVLEPLIFLVVEPLVYGTTTGVSDVALLIAVGFWTWLWGAPGLILATPLTVCLVVLGKYVPALSFLEVLMGDEPALAPHLAYYQRLLADDEDEAVDIVEAYLAAHSPEEIYDGLFVPALVQLKQDRARGALDEADERAVLARTREILEELPLRGAAGSGDRAALEVLGCPARDEADELALTMLGHLLDSASTRLKVVSSRMLAAEVVALAEAVRPPVVCIGAVPPGGLAHSRYLAKRLRAALPEARILVGRWGEGPDSREPTSRLTAVGADEVATTLRETRDQVFRLFPVAREAPPETEATARSA